jgi:hypothetical protein
MGLIFDTYGNGLLMKRLQNEFLKKIRFSLKKEEMRKENKNFKNIREG